MKIQIMLLLTISLLFTACIHRHGHGRKGVKIKKPVIIKPAVVVPRRVIIR